MEKTKEKCVLDEMRIKLLRFFIELTEDELREAQETYSVPERKSPLAKYEIKEQLDEKCVTADGRSFYMETFMPDISGGKKLPVIVSIHGGGFVREDRRYRRQYLRAMASRGFLIFEFDYVRPDDVSITCELRDICDELEVVAERIKDYDTDPSRIFMTGDSAGAYLALYIAAMGRSEKLRKAVGCGVPAISPVALGCFSGMFYIDRYDPSCWLLSTFECSKSKEDRKFQKYIDPDCDEVIRNLPPVFLATSRGDFMNDYTLSLHETLKKAGKRSHLLYKGDSDLIHAFPTIIPNQAESIEVLDRLTVWFEEEVKEAKRSEKRHKEELKALDEINARIESGEIIDQKAWKFIRELNSYSRERLDAVAFVNGRTEYTYRQMFRKWERYAEVFSALGMTGKNGSRVVIRSTPAAETIFALFALNMTGASVSLSPILGANNIERLRGMSENENLTDVILPDNALDESYLKRVIKEKDELGIRNVIVMHVPKMGEFACLWDEDESLRKYKRLKKIDGVLFMDDLLAEYEAWPISYSDEMRDDAMITHTSGTTTGANKSVPMSDRGINETSVRLLADDRFGMMKGRASTLLLGELSSAYTLYNELMLAFAFGGRVAVLPPSDRTEKTMP